MSPRKPNGITDENLLAFICGPILSDAHSEEEKQSIQEFTEVARSVEAQLPLHFAVGSKVRVNGQSTMSL